MASTEFIKALKNKSAAKAAMKSLNSAEAGGGGFQVPDVPDGVYIMAVKAECGITPNKAIPFVKLNWEIVDDTDYKGSKSNMTYFLEAENEDQLEMTFSSLGRAFKVLLGTENLDLEDAADIAGVVDQINDEDVYSECRVKNWKGKNDKKGINVYFNKRVYVDE